MLGAYELVPHVDLANTLQSPGPILQVDVEVGADRRRMGASSAGAITNMGSSGTATNQIEATKATVVPDVAINFLL